MGELRGVQPDKPGEPRRSADRGAGKAGNRKIGASQQRRPAALPPCHAPKPRACPLRAYSWSTQPRARPPRLARYKARSARSIHCPALCPGCSWATPKLAVTDSCTGSQRTRIVAMAWRRRSASSSAAACVVSGISSRHTRAAHSSGQRHPHDPPWHGRCPPLPPVISVSHPDQAGHAAAAAVTAVGEELRRLADRALVAAMDRCRRQTGGDQALTRQRV